MSLLLARDALPGDTLYAVKRTGEAASLGLTFGNEDKAFKHLEFATARITEIETLTQRYPNPQDAPLGGFLSALSDFDNDAAAGSRQLIALATAGDGSQLESLRTWANTEGSRLAVLGPRLPSAAVMRQAASTALLYEIEARATALANRIGCYQVTSGSIDDIGALPATATCEQQVGRESSVPPRTQAGTNPTAINEVPSVATAVTPPIATPSAPNQPGATEPGVSVLTTTPPGTAVPPPVGEPSTTSILPSGNVSPTAPVIAVPLPLPLPTVAVPPLLGLLPGLVIG
jgi:hypothetical protein